MELIELTGRQRAIFDLLAQPDPLDLPARRHVYTYDGHPHRRQKYLEPLFMAFLARRAIDRHDDSFAFRSRKMNVVDIYRLRGKREGSVSG